MLCEFGELSVIVQNFKCSTHKFARFVRLIVEASNLIPKVVCKSNKLKITFFQRI